MRVLVNLSFMIPNNEGNRLPLADWAVFVAVAEAGGFSAAARRLRVSKAMASVAVTRLEQRLGVKLLARTTRRLALTEAGASTLPHAQRALLAARDAEDAAQQVQLSPRGRLRVNAPMSFGLLHLVPALGAFARAHPEVSVDLVLDDRVVDLVEGGFDLAVRIGTLRDSALVAQRLGRSRNVLVAHPSYLDRRGKPKTPKALADHACLLYSLSSSGPRWTLGRGARSTTVRVSGPVSVNSSLALQQAVHQGLGIARIPWFIVGEDLTKERLVRVLPQWEAPEEGIFAVTTQRDYTPHKTRSFIDFLRSRLGATPYWERGRPAPSV